MIWLMVLNHEPSGTTCAARKPLLNVIYSLQRTNIEAIKDYLALELVPILFDMVVLNHDDYHVNICKELIEVIVLVICNLVAYEEWIVALERTSEMTLLKEKNIKMGGIVYSINWCTGVKEDFLFSSDGDVHSMSKRTL